MKSEKIVVSASKLFESIDKLTDAEKIDVCNQIKTLLHEHQESLHRYCAIATWEKRGLTLNGKRWTTKIVDEVYNIYPIYDWLVEDIWRFNGKYQLPHNMIYDKMQMAGVPLSQQRLCQPFGDDQRRGLWLYHILEPETWSKLVARVNGANSGALYVEERGNITGYDKISKPPNHTWKS